jgi:menaquinol-cytochrome c reductase iron-sulfur subunit
MACWPFHRTFLWENRSQTSFSDRLREVKKVGVTPSGEQVNQPSRRTFHAIASVVLGSVIGAVLSIPGVAFILSPILKGKSSGTDDSRADGFQALAKLSDLEEGVPKVFPVLGKTKDAWVQYPEEPIGSVWLIRQGKDVTAFSAECPHLGCAVSLGPEGKTFFCPCHTSTFEFDGKPKNAVPPRGMDTLEVKLSAAEDPEIRVKFLRFRTAIPEKTTLA